MILTALDLQLLLIILRDSLKLKDTEGLYMSLTIDTRELLWKDLLKRMQEDKFPIIIGGGINTPTTIEK